MSNLLPTSESTFTSGNTTLHGEWFAGPNVSVGLAIVLHGYAEHCGRYREVIATLVESGLAVFTYDMRGHGKSSGKRGHIDKFADYRADLDAAYKRANMLADAIHVGSKRIVLAHSNGGLVALHALSHGWKLDAAIISSPFIGLKLAVPGLKKAAATLLSRLIPTLSMGTGMTVDQLTHDLKKREERLADTLCNEVATARWFTETLTAQAEVIRDAHTINIPTLWLIAGDDVIADPSVSSSVASTLKMPAEVHILAGFSHEIFNEIDRAKPLGQVAEFVGRLA